MPEDKKPMTFQVVVNDVALTEAHIQNLAEKIKTLMLSELARIDNRGDLKAKPLATARGGFNGGRTAGMVLDRE